MSESFYLNAGLPVPGGPSEDGLDAPFWEALDDERIVIQRCNGCQTWQWGPEWICHKCRSFDVGWGEVPPQGVLFSWQRVWHPSHPALKEQGPYLVVLVELPTAGNVRVIGNLLGDPLQDVRIGTTVTAFFEHHRDVESPYTLLQWRVVDGG